MIENEWFPNRPSAFGIGSQGGSPVTYFSDPSPTCDCGEVSGVTQIRTSTETMATTTAAIAA